MALKSLTISQTAIPVILSVSEESEHLSGLKDSSFHFVPFRMTQIQTFSVRSLQIVPVVA